MKFQRTTISFVTFSVVFFLTFLGMRLAFLDKTTKPKAKSRAVLTLTSKSLTSYSSHSKHNFSPLFADCRDIAEFITPEFTQSCIVAINFINPVKSYGIRLVQDRSPPRS